MVELYTTTRVRLCILFVVGPRVHNKFISISLGLNNTIKPMKSDRKLRTDVSLINFRQNVTVNTSNQITTNVLRCPNYQTTNKEPPKWLNS